MMESAVSKLRKDFKTKVQNKHTTPSQFSSTALLTDEELNELENAWVQLITWQQANPIT